MTMVVRGNGSLRFPGVAMRGAAASATDFAALQAEVIAAREGQPSLDAKLDIMESAATATTNEVVAARSGSASLDARIDGIASEVGTARGSEANLDARLDTMTAATTTVANEVAAAREGQPSLDAKLDIMETAAAATTAEVVAGRGSQANLDARFDLIEGEISTARGGAGSLDNRLDGMQTTISANANELATARQGAGTLDNRLDAMQTSITANQTAIGSGPTGLDGRLDAVETEITTARQGTASLDTRLDAMQTSITANTTAIGSGPTGLDGRLDAVETEITTARAGAGTLDNRLDAMQTTISANASELATARQGAGTLDNRLDAMQTSITANTTELTNARSGSASLDERMDADRAAALATTNEVIAARDGRANLDARFDDIETEIITARGGEATLDARLDTITTGLTGVANEVVQARGGEASLDARLDAMSVAAGAGVPQAEFDVLENEVVTARSGAASLDARIDPIAASAAAAEGEVVAARQGAASLDARLDTMQTTLTQVSDAAAGHGTLDARLDAMQAATAANTTAIGDAAGGSGTLDNRLDAMQDNINSRVPQTRLVATGGLATGGGDLTVNRQINVPIATPPEAVLGERNDVAMTPLQDKNALNQRVGPLEDDVENLTGTIDAGGSATWGVEGPAQPLVNDLIFGGAIATKEKTPGAGDSSVILGYGRKASDADKLVAWAQILRVLEQLELGKDVEVLWGDYNWDFAYVDRNNEVQWGYKGGVFYAPVSAEEEEETETLGVKDNRNRSIAAGWRGEKLLNLAALNQRDNVVIGNPDQSNGNSAAEAWPAILTTPITGAWMLGSSATNADTRPQNLAGAGWTRFGGVSQVWPMRATVRDTAGTGFLTPEEAALLAAGEGNPGQNHMVSLCAGIRPWLDDYHGQNTTSLIEFYGIACGEGGRKLAELGKATLDPANWDGIDRWSKMVQGLDFMCDAIEALGAGRVPQVAFATSCQGESDQLAFYTYEYYKDLRNRYYDDMDAEIKLRIPTQTRKCIKYVILTGGSYTRPNDSTGKFDNAICRALLDLSWERDDVVVVMPYYHTWDKAQHHTANAHLAWGIKLAEAVYTSSVERTRFRALQPIAIEKSGRNIDIHIATETPLVFKQCAFNGTFINVLNQGFCLAPPAWGGPSGRYGIASVTIPHPTIIRVRTSTDLPDDTMVGYANHDGYDPVASQAGAQGNGNVFNSKRIPPLLVHKFLAGMYGPDMPTLDGTEIDTSDALVPFVYPCNWERNLS